MTPGAVIVFSCAGSPVGRREEMAKWLMEREGCLPWVKRAGERFLRDPDREEGVWVKALSRATVTDRADREYVIFEAEGAMCLVEYTPEGFAWMEGTE